MKYKLDNKIIFDPQRGALYSLEENIEVIEDVLARPTSRLLHELLKNNKQIVSRDELLDRVWSDYGAIPSGSNLNNHLTLLRKRFDFWGIQRKSIISVPRKGIMLNILLEEVEGSLPLNECNVIESKQQEYPPGEKRLISANEIQPQSDTKTRRELTLNQRFFSFRNLRILTITITVFVLTVFVLTLYISLKYYNSYTDNNYVIVGQCHVSTITSGFIKLRSENKDALISTLKSLIDKKEISCDEPKDVYISRRPYIKSLHIYVSECKIKDASNYKDCQSYQFIDK